MKKILTFTIFCLLLIASTTNMNAQLTPCPAPEPSLELESEFCNTGAGIPYNVTACTDFIASEDGGNDIIYVLSIYFDPASPTPFQAPPGTTFIDVFDAADNYVLYDGFFYDCLGTVNPLPTSITVSQGVFYEPIVDITAIASNTCEPVVVSVFAVGFDRTNFQQVDCDAIEIPITLYPEVLAANVTDDGSTCGTPTVELTAADGTVCETLTGTACGANGDEFTTDFAATATGTALADAPAACALPADVTVSCANCDSDCMLDDLGLATAPCDNAGTTAEDDSADGDDTFMLTINPTGMDTGATYTVSGDAAGAGTYGTALTIMLPADGATLSITVTDDTDPTCGLTQTITAPGPCSMIVIPPDDVPTVGEWGLIILGLMMSIVAVIGIRQSLSEEATA